MTRKTTTTNGLVLFKDVELDAKLALIQEYDDLDPTQRKGWRDKHSADSALLTYYRRKYMNGRPKVKLRGPVIDIKPVQEVSLAQAILAFEVKRDHMNEFIEELKRIRKGGR